MNATGSISVFTGSPQPRPGPRDHLPAGGRRDARHRREPDRHRARRHRARSRSAWAPTARARSRSAARRSCKATEKIIAKAKKIAAHLMEASDADIELKDGKFTVAGTDKSVAWTDVTLAAYVPHNYPLDEHRAGAGGDRLLRSGELHLSRPAPTSARSRSTPRPGAVEVVGFACRRRLRQRRQPDDRRGPGPRRRRAGHRPGAARERGLRRRTASCRPGRYMDYAMPRADDVPCFVVDHSCVTPCTHNPLGVKGCGEAGAIGAPPALVNAVIDALQSGGHDVDAHRHAAVAGPGLGGDRRRREAGRRHRITRRAPAAREDTPMYAFDFVKPTTRRRGRRGARRRGRPGARRRPDADPDAEAAPRAARRCWSACAASPRSRACASTTPAGSASAAAPPTPSSPARPRRTIRRWPRWRATSAIRRCATSAPSAAASPTTTRRPAIRRRCWRSGATIVTNTREIAADDYFQGMFTTALEPGEIITEVRFPIPTRRELPEVRPAGVALRPGRRVRRASSGRRARRGHRRLRGRRVPLVRGRGGARGRLHARARCAGLKADADGMIGDLHGTPEYRAHLIGVLTARAVAAAA